MGLESRLETTLLDSAVSPGSGELPGMFPGSPTGSSGESNPDSTELGFSAKGKVKSTGANSPVGSVGSGFVAGTASPPFFGKGKTDSTAASGGIPFGRGLSIRVSRV